MQPAVMRRSGRRDSQTYLAEPSSDNAEAAVSSWGWGTREPTSRVDRAHETMPMRPPWKGPALRGAPG